MNDISAINDLSAFQQTPSARVRDAGPPMNANPPPPPPSDPSQKLQQEPSPHPNRGQWINLTI